MKTVPKLTLDDARILMAAAEQKAREIGSSILQTNINYRDIRDRVEKIRALVEKLSG